MINIGPATPTFTNATNAMSPLNYHRIHYSLHGTWRTGARTFRTLIVSTLSINRTDSARKNWDATINCPDAYRRRHREFKAPLPGKGRAHVWKRLHESHQCHEFDTQMRFFFKTLKGCQSWGRCDMKAVSKGRRFQSTMSPREPIEAAAWQWQWQFQKWAQHRARSSAVRNAANNLQKRQ